MKANRNLITNKSGNANLIILAIFTVIVGFGMLTIGTYLYFAIATSADAGTRTILPGVAATDTLTFTGNASCGEYVNITTTSGVLVPFEFNITSGLGDVGNSCPSGIASSPSYVIVNLSVNQNYSVNAAPNLSSAINKNVTLSAVLTASNATNRTILTYKTVGTTGNSVIATTTLALASWTLGTFYGGVEPVTGQASQNSLNNYVVITFPLFGLALMILGFGVIFVTIKKSLGSAGR